ncbi:FtsX-like permease family protein [Streptomyces qinglanensis]|uniref:ABC3 transporter permease C-terminal domain-containing protein n=1 Tax=Streptomyces qinglanensis TaxID=943816 RepID=A0A1H9WJG2_9ACTN|nr:FtsX-like permease family protein [Streptomyces qinglanensis]SES34076.1 hypothetical protein SAMN05421870_11869 [Streptomyces qinglanensis]
MSAVLEMRPAVLLRLARAGTRTDTLRVVLTAAGALLGTLALLAGLTVAAIGTPLDVTAGSRAQSDQYSSLLLRQPGLRPGVCLAFGLLTLPVLALAGQCARIGAPARDRRLAALRLAGATPRQSTAVVATETGLAALLGACAGFAVHFTLRAVLDEPNADGRLPLPTDVLPHPVGMAAVLLGIPLLSAASSAVLTRRVVVSPLGVTRRVRTRVPRPWPGLLLLAAAAAFAGVGALRPEESGLPETDSVLVEGGLPLLLLLIGGVCTVLGLVLGTAWISHTAGRILHRHARRAPALLAARRLIADPWHGSRTLSAFLACVLVGAGAAAVRATFSALWDAETAAARYEARAGVDDRALTRADPFYLDSMFLVDVAVVTAAVIAVGGLLVALAEAVAARRRTHAALIASGVPRSVLARATLWQTLAPAVPAVLLALSLGTALGRGVMGRKAAAGGHRFRACVAADGCPDALTDANSKAVEVPEMVRTTHIPWAELAFQAGGALVLLLAATAAALLFLRSTASVEELRTQ